MQLLYGELKPEFVSGCLKSVFRGQRDDSVGGAEGVSLCFSSSLYKECVFPRLQCESSPADGDVNCTQQLFCFSLLGFFFFSKCVFYKLVKFVCVCVCMKIKF